MNASDSIPPEPPAGGTYSLAVITRMAGVSSETVIRYQEAGLLPSGAGEFDDETLHTLRRIEHLRATCEPNLSGLRLILQLLDQVEQLRAVLRRRN